MFSTDKQKGRIKKFQKILGIDDSTYREMLFQRYQVESSKDLLEFQAEEFFKELNAKAIKLNLYDSGAAKKLKNKGKYENKVIADNKATPKQRRYIDYLWSTVSFMEDEKAREEALNKFLKKIVGCEQIDWLEKKDVSKVVKALEQMQKEKKK